MSKKNLARILFWSLIFYQITVSNSSAQINNRQYSNERLVIKSLQTISAAQATYSSTVGNGDYGSNLDLLEAEFIDEVLAGGIKYGYYFMFYKSPQTLTAPAKFSVMATPQSYGKAGKMSFYLDESGIHGADKNGGTASKNDPFIDPCFIYEYEKCAIAALRSLLGAQMTFQSTSGAGEFGTLNQLYKAGLTNKLIGDGFAHGYRLKVTVRVRTSTSEAFFSISATPDKYGANTVRSFYIDAGGVLRGADKNGSPAGAGDPPISD